MKAIKTTGIVNKQGQLSLDSPLVVEKLSRVEVIILVPEETKKEILGDLKKAW